MTFVYFDIETIPAQDDAALERAYAGVKPPANIKKPESIEKWMNENAEAAAIEALGKTSFDGGRGHVCTIAWAIEDGEIMSAHVNDLDNESYAISMFFDAVRSQSRAVLVGHNILGFDIPFLTKRAVVLGVKLPFSSSWPRDPKPWEKSCQDTMIMWAGGRGTVSMNDLCDIFGIPGKGDGMHGSEVAQAWADGRHDEIAEYCREDVMRTREMHRRFIAAGW